MIFKPSLIIAGFVTEIELDALKDLGIQGMILDLDNTIMPPKTCQISESVRSWLQDADNKGFQKIVVSNNKNIEYCKAAEHVVQMPVLPYARKPSLSVLSQAREQLNLPAHQIAVIGDRPLTDIVGGLRLGAYTILVDPLMKYEEPPVIQFLRALERSVIRPA